MATVAERVQARIERFRSDRVTDAGGAGRFLHGRPARPGDIVLTSNDYLALASEGRITRATATALGRDGERSPADVHRKPLAHMLSEHMHAGSGIVCQSGWAANTGLLQAIADTETPVHIDEQAHMSLRHGAVGAGASVHTFRHNRPDHLRDQLHRHGPGIVAVDAIYSTSGGRSPLPELCDVADETGSVLVVDESHSLGIDGPHGEGAVAALGLADRVPFRTASLAKAFAGRAGFIAVRSPDFVGYFEQASYPAVFSSALRPHDIAGLAATVEVIRAAEDRRARLRGVADVVRKELGSLGFDLEGSDSQIVSVPTGPESRGLAIRSVLERHGVLGAPFCPPATPPNRSLIRFSLHAALSDADIDRIILACTEVRDRYGATAPDRRVLGRG
ncbi:aminotransferase class I/II-fold pyridoxal phosphate-dependent enzyme [Nocardia sp. BMG51109]|uniref:aminotransferase class I/II-fold pyridoxal phosphate-dependent enzyme n=1 Tax=Nocardia sp. BMG51109 TaxID=1056816 RepID=UPI0018DCD60F|nr:aminotransferase class I/II-fold pyridoxal phosphate-dependent enzyme [Nocardia sp. BMG51109]